jgi:hypothetical protein
MTFTWRESPTTPSQYKRSTQISFGHSWNAIRVWTSFALPPFSVPSRPAVHRTEAELPSWVPDWRVTVRPLVCPLMVSQSAGSIGNFRPHHSLKYSACYSASSSSKPNVSFTSDLRQISCEGILLGCIDSLTDSPAQNWSSYLPGSNPFYQNRSRSTILPNKSGSQFVPQIAKSLMRCLVLNRMDHYLNHQAPEQQYMKEFLACIAETMDDAHNADVFFLSWFKANQHFRIQGLELRNIATILLRENWIGCWDRSNELNRESFISRFHDTAVKMARRLAVSETGLLVMVPKQTKRDDSICILYGCSVPVILRRCQSTGAYRFVGECYVDGFMNSEATGLEGAYTKRSFLLI